jgi:hypothetical protein
VLYRVVESWSLRRETARSTSAATPRLEPVAGD